MTPADIRTQITASGLTQNEWCRKHGLAGRTVRRWLSGHTPVPKWLEAVLGLPKAQGKGVVK